MLSALHDGLADCTLQGPEFPSSAATPVTRVADAGQKRRALLSCGAIALVTALLFPLADTLWPRWPAFLPTYQAAVIFEYLLCAYLVFGHYRATGAVALLYLGAGCFYTGVVLIAQFLSVPGMFGPQSFLPGGAQTTIWLWAFWHAGPALGMLLFAISEWRNSGRIEPPTRRAVGGVALALILSIGATVLLVTAFHDYLPVLDINGDYRGITTHGIAQFLQALTLIALLLLWRTTRLRTVLQVWLAVALFALLCDNAITMAGGSRLSVGWYIGRANALVSATVLLVVYLREINASYLRTARTADMLALRTSQLTAAQDKLQHQNQELDSFAHAVSHDLRAPLRAMSGFSSALQKDYARVLDDTANRYLEQIAVATVRMSGLIDGLLQLSQSTRGDLRRDHINLSAMAHSILSQLQQEAPSRPAQWDIQDNLTAWGDARLIEVALYNLLGNAWKYSSGVDRPSIRFYAERAGNQTWFRVADNGAGFDMRHSDQLFKPFQRLHRQDEFSGIGIGLATVQRIVCSHGGEIRAEGHLGQGAVFSFTLPVQAT